MRKIIGLLCIGLLISGCAKTTGIKEVLTPENTLISFFDALSRQNFNEALHYFSQENEVWESLRIYTLPEETDHADIIKNYCQATLTCLPATIVRTTKVSDDEYLYHVQFQREDGSIFILGPCCGATEKEMPPQDTFEYTIKRIDGVFKVITPPVYVP